MRFERMRPGQLREAIERGVPFVLPIGVMEYHGGHLPAGVDLLAVLPPVQLEVQAAIDRAEGRSRPMVGIERFAFYDFARRSYAVIQTGERRFWGCFMFRKGVIPPDA